MIALIVAVCGTILGIQKIEFSQFERGGDTPLGLSLGLDLQGGSHLVYEAALRDQQTGEPIEVSEDQMHSLVKTIERRINSSGLGEPIIQILGNDRLLIQLPGVRDPGRAKTLIGETARLEFKHRSISVDPVALDYIVPEDVVSITADDMRADGKLMSELTPDDINDQTKTLASFPSLVVDFSEFGADKFQQVALNLSISIALSMDAAQRGDILPPDLLVVSVTGE